ncbi:microtubule-associated protein 9 [Patella vulgata]|uniref:microtubule-associated protein 9 n=1 Tax=Patella vulgata TaxID=6465 RepID=UPI0024A91336|nr:microtubule-associated protein 9 [Patella vulgata]XP_055955408.1 microtubule-associated protein 9 [Patella vulgata]
MDEVDSTMRRRQPKVRNVYDNELNAKLAQRRKDGLTTDMTTSDDSDDDNVGSLDFNSSLRNRNRPNSAKRRQDPRAEWQPDLGATLKFQDRDNLMNTLGRDDSRTNRFYKNSNLNIKNKESPRDDRKTPTSFTADDILNGRNTPTKNDERKSPFLSRKSPLSNLNENDSEWQPISYQKKNLSNDFLSRDISGRSPESSLDPLVESSGTLDSARRRKQLERSPRLEPLDSPTNKPSPRPRKGEKVEEPKKKRPPNMDLFGSRRSFFDEEDEAEINDPSPRAKRRLSKDKELNKTTASGRKTPVEGRKTPTDGRKTPTDGRKTPVGVNGRRTPVGVDGRKTPVGGRKTPTDKRNGLTDERRSIGRKTPTDEDRKTPVERNKSLMDMLVGDQVDHPTPRERKSSLRKERSHDSNFDELNEYDSRNRSSLDRQPSVERRRSKRQVDADQSSVCEEYEVDPNPPFITNSSVEPKPRKYKNQTEEHKNSDMAIDVIADAQNGMTYIDPDKQTETEKTQTKQTTTQKIKPKPRYKTQEFEPIKFDPNDTKSMRQAIFEEWYRTKTEKLKETIIEKKKTEKQKIEHEQQEKKEKQLEAMSSFNAWAEKKKDVLKQKAREKSKEQRKKDEELQEKEAKKKDAAKSFESWSKTKQVVLKKEINNKVRTEKEREEEEKAKKKMRAKSAESAFRSWNQKKEVSLKVKAKDMKKTKPDLYEEEKLRAQKEEEAREKYEIWLENKEKREEKERLMRQRKHITDDSEFRPPWSPAQRTIPFGR